MSGLETDFKKPKTETTRKSSRPRSSKIGLEFFINDGITAFRSKRNSFKLFQNEVLTRH